MDVPWDIFWESKPYAGKVGDPRRQARRARDADAARRDARRAPARPQHRGPDDRRQGRQGPRAADGHRQRQGRDHRLPDAARGQDVAPPVVVGRPAQRRVLLHAEGRPAERALVLGPGRRTASSRTTSSASAARRRTRRSPTGSSTSCSTRRSPTTTSSTTSATRRRRSTIDAESLIKSGLIPKSLTSRRRPPRPVRLQPGAAPAERRRASATGTRPGRSSRPAERWARAGPGGCSRFPGVAWLTRLLPARVLRRHRGRVRQPEHALRAGPVLEPARLERRLHARDAREHLCTAASS